MWVGGWDVVGWVGCGWMGGLAEHWTEVSDELIT